MNVEVMKMMGCGDLSLGFIVYICLKCLEILKIDLHAKVDFLVNVVKNM